MLPITKRIFLLGSGLVLISCVQESNGVTDPAPMALANPASTKCVADGYQLTVVPVVRGVGSELRCYNSKNKKQCEEWDYYRGKCTLE